MYARRRIWMLVLVMIGVATGVEAIALTVLYRAAFQQQRERLASLAVTEARFLEAVARFDLEESADYPGGALEATLRQFREAHRLSFAMGKTGEFTLARRVGDSIAFLLRQRAGEPLAPLTLPLSGHLAEPQTRALSGESGILVGSDYAGARVLAAFEPVGIHGLGIVAKMEMAEIRSPFIRAGLLAGGGGILLVLLGSVLFFRFSEPLVLRLRSSEERHRALARELEAVFEASPLPLFVLDTEGRVKQWNPAAERTFGWTEEEVLDRDSPLVPLGREGEARALRERVAGGEALTGLELRRQRRDGSELDVRLSAAPLRDAGGSVAGMVTLLEDITGEKAAAEALREREALLDAITRNLPWGILHLFDRDFRYLFSAGAEMGHVGLTGEELVGKSIHEVLGPEVAPMVEAQYRRVLEGNTVRFEGEYGGEWFLVNAAPLRGADGEVDRILALSLNVTEQRVAEAGLVRQRELFQAVIDNAPAMIALTSPDGRWVLANRAFQETLGWSLEEIREAPEFMAALYPEASERGRALAAIAAGTGEWADFRTRTREGRVLDTTWANVRMADGTGVGIGQDITARKQMERELREWNTALEVRVEERTRELAEANRELEAFSYTVSHDLKAPLRAIDGFSRIIENDYGGLLDEEGRRVVGVVRSNTRQMAQLIEDLLAFSRLGRAVLASGPVELEAVVASALEDLAAEMEGRRVELTVEELPVVLGDRLLLRQAVMNLLANALKFTTNREVAELRVGSYAEAGRVVLFVRDNGVGFDSAYTHKLFGVFQRLHHPDEFPGTGVGLAIVRRIVERHGGRVWAEGEPGRGATFYLALPSGEKDIQ